MGEEAAIFTLGYTVFQVFQALCREHNLKSRRAGRLPFGRNSRRRAASIDPRRTRSQDHSCHAEHRHKGDGDGEVVSHGVNPSRRVS